MKQNNLVKNIGVFALCAILTAGVVFGIKFLKYSKLAKTGTESAQQTFIQPTQPTAEPKTQSSAQEVNPYVAKGMTAEQKAMHEVNVQMYNQIKGDVDARSAQIMADSDYQKAINPIRKKEQAQKDIENAFQK